MSVRALIEKLSEWERDNPGMSVVVGNYSTALYAEVLEQGTIYVMPKTDDVAVIKTRDRRKKTILNSR